MQVTVYEISANHVKQRNVLNLPGFLKLTDYLQVKIENKVYFCKTPTGFVTVINNKLKNHNEILSTIQNILKESL